MTAKEALQLTAEGSPDRERIIREEAARFRQGVDAKVADEARAGHTCALIPYVIFDPAAKTAIDRVLVDLHTDGYKVYPSELNGQFYLDLSWGNIH